MEDTIMTERRRFDADFKRRIAEMILDGTCTRAEVQREHGLRSQLISRWLGDYQRGSGWARSAEKLAADRDSAADKRRIRELEAEIAFLKKTTTYFAALGKTK